MTPALGEPREPVPFSLLGGPLHRLGLRVGLVQADGNTMRLGLAIGGSLWGVLVVLALIDGIDLTALTVIGGQHA